MKQTRKKSDKAGTTPRKYEFSVILQAQDYFTAEGLSLKDIAVLMGIPKCTLARWRIKYNWVEKRTMLVQAIIGIRADKIMVRARMLERLKQDGDNKTALAVAALENSALREAKQSKPGFILPAATKNPHLPQDDFANDTLHSLELLIQQQLTVLLKKPQSFDIKNIRDLKACFDVLNSMHNPDPEGKNDRALSQENAEQLRQMLGIRADSD